MNTGAESVYCNLRAQSCAGKISRECEDHLRICTTHPSLMKDEGRRAFCSQTSCKISGECKHWYRQCISRTDLRKENFSTDFRDNNMSTVTDDIMNINAPGMYYKKAMGIENFHLQSIP